MKKIYFIILLNVSFLSIYSQNGTQPDSARVISGSLVTRTINVLDNDILVATKNYSLFSVYKSTTNNSYVINIVGNSVTFRETQDIASNDTFYYVAKDNVTNTFDTNYVVVRKSNLLLDLYPGDANRDNICNNIDVLNVGVALGKTGDIREGIFNTSVWGAVKAYDWTSSNSVSNHRFSDANGDGIVDSMGDVGTINQNYNQVNTSAISTVYSPTGGKNFIINTVDTLKVVGTSTNFQVGVELGSASSPVNSCYGIAFTIKYDTAIFKPNKVNFTPSKWFLDQHNTLNFSKINANKGEIDVAIVRKNGSNNSGGGALGIIDILVDDILGGLASGIKTDIQITKAVLVDSFLTKIPVTLATPKDLILIKKSTSSVLNNAKKEINVYQNNDQLNIEVNRGRIDKISIYNLLGKEVYSNNSSLLNQKIEIDIANWSSGIYLVKVDSMTKKIIIK